MLRIQAGAQRPADPEEQRYFDAWASLAVDDGGPTPVVLFEHNVEYLIWQRLAAIGYRQCGRLRLIDPPGYLDFLALQSHAAVVLTDSGGVQEETTVLGVPCLTLRENTERPITVSQGTNRLVGSSPSAIIAAVRESLNGARRPELVPELWDGRAAERITKVLRSAALAGR